MGRSRASNDAGRFSSCKHLQHVNTCPRRVRSEEEISPVQSCVQSGCALDNLLVNEVLLVMIVDACT